MRAWKAAAALVAAGALLAGCGGESGGRIAACDVDPATPALVRDREAAGIADCDTIPTRPAAASSGSSGSSSKPLPDVVLDCLGGTTRVALADVRGPAVINFWSTTCAPCRKEMPLLEQFRRDYGQQVAMIGVNYADTYPGAAVDFARIVGAAYPSLADPCARLSSGSVVLQGLPQFVWLRADGTWTQTPGGVESLTDLVDLARTNLGIDLPPPAASDAPGETS